MISEKGIVMMDSRLVAAFRVSNRMKPDSASTMVVMVKYPNTSTTIPMMLSAPLNPNMAIWYKMVMNGPTIELLASSSPSQNKIIVTNVNGTKASNPIPYDLNIVACNWAVILDPVSSVMVYKTGKVGVVQLQAYH